MSSEIVGLENLPNVYISKIILSDNNSESFNVSVGLQLMDTKQGNGYLWSDEKIIYNFLRVGLITTSDTNLNNKLTKNIFTCLLMMGSEIILLMLFQF